MPENGTQGLVAQLLSDEEIVLNVGSIQGVRVGHVYEVLDPLTQGVRDPKTGENLGSIDRVLARVSVYQVAPKLALARKWPRRKSGLTAAAEVLSGVQVTRPTPSRWPEGVKVGDPVRFTGKVMTE